MQLGDGWRANKWCLFGCGGIWDVSYHVRFIGKNTVWDYVEDDWQATRRALMSEWTNRDNEFT